MGKGMSDINKYVHLNFINFIISHKLYGQLLVISDTV